MKIPLFPLDLVLFPGVPLPLHIFEERYKEMIGNCVADGSVFGVVRAQREGLAVIGCTARVINVMNKYDDGRMDILCEGIDRFEIEFLDNSLPCLQAEIALLPDEPQSASRALREEVVAMHYETLELAGIAPNSLTLDMDTPVSFLLADSLPSDLDFKQELLTISSDADRTQRLLTYYKAVLPKLRRGVQASRSAATNGHIM